MSLFRTAVIIVIAVSLLPSDPEGQRALKRTALGMSEQATTFCESRPNICVSREDAWEGLKAKAWFAYTLGHELVYGQRSYAASPDVDARPFYAPAPRSYGEHTGYITAYDRDRLARAARRDIRNSSIDALLQDDSRF
ncbi:MAG: hypothetical protein AAFZ01_12300 [Pseudomonadota bacterium]